MTAAVDNLLAAVAAAGLPGSLRELPRHELAEQQAQELVGQAERHRIAGVTLTAALEGRLTLPAVVFDALIDAHIREMVTCLNLEHELLVISSLLDDAGIESRVLDACAVAHLDYEDPALRAFSQLDLLVRPADLRGAIEVLRRHEWQHQSARPHSPLNTAMFTRPSGLRVEVHTNVHPVPNDISVPLRELWSDGQEFAVGDQRLTALGSELRLLHACCTAVSAGPEPPPAINRDIAEMVLFGVWNHARLMNMAISWRAQTVLAHAVQAAWQRLLIADVTSLSVWAQGYRDHVNRRPQRHEAAAAVSALPLSSGNKLRRLSRRT